MSNSLQPHESQPSRPPCPSPWSHLKSFCSTRRLLPWSLIYLFVTLTVYWLSISLQHADLCIWWLLLPLLLPLAQNAAETSILRFPIPYLQLSPLYHATLRPSVLTLGTLTVLQGYLVLKQGRSSPFYQLHSITSAPTWCPHRHALIYSLNLKIPQQLIPPGHLLCASHSPGYLGYKDRQKLLN